MEIYNNKFQKAADNHLKKSIDELRNTNPRKAWNIMKKIGANRYEDRNKGTCSLSEHQNNNLSNQKSIEKIADYFSGI